MEVPVITTPSVDPNTSTILVLSKVCSMFCLGLGSLLLGTLPLIIGRCRSKKCESRRVVSSVSSTSSTTSQADSSSQSLLTSLLLCFGGGVLLFTTFLHLAPEIRESVEIHQANGQLPTLSSLSLAELLFCAGFFLVYLVEESVHALLSDKPESSDALLYRTVSVRRCNHTSPNHQQHNSGSSNSNSNSNRNNNRNNNNNNNNNHNNYNNNKKKGNSNRSKSSSIVSGVYPVQSAWRSSEGSDADEDGSSVKGDCPVGKHSSNPVFLARLPARSQLQQQHRGCEEAGLKHKPSEHSHVHQHDNSMRSLLTVLALSFHSIFEGLAVGLEPTLSSVLYLAAAIATHKFVIAFCVGMELYVAGATKKTILGYLSIFSMVTPLGIAIGLGLGHMRNDSETLGPTPTILQGMAAGTLLYVVFFEVLARERANDKSGLLQLAAIFVGFMLMLALQYVTAHSHDHGDHSHVSEDHKHIGHDHHESDQSVTDKHNYVLGTAIEQVTTKVMDVLSTTMT